MLPFVAIPLKGKGAKFGTNEADTVQIKNRLGGISRISKFLLNFNMPFYTKAFDHRAKATEETRSYNYV